MIGLAVICTIASGVLSAAFVHPDSFAFSIPVAVMGAFILKAIKDKRD